jgi:restriction system protein
MANSVFSQTIANVQHVESTRSYWYVRTNSGDYYDQFKKSNIIAIGWNYLTIKNIGDLKKNPAYREELARRVTKNDGINTKPGYVINQIVDFVENIKKGDIVMIPSESSDFYSFGEIIDDQPYQAVINSEDSLPYEKRRKVKWLQFNVPYLKLDPYLFKLKWLQKTITQLDALETAQAIDRSIESLFIKDQKAHYVIRVTQESGIQTFGLFSAMVDLFDITNNVAKSLEVDFDKQEIEGKINVQSPGHIELITYSIAGLLVFAGVAGLVMGIDFEGKVLGAGIKFKTKGLIKSISEALDSKENRKLVKDAREKLGKTELNSADIVNILKVLNGDSKGNDNS